MKTNSKTNGKPIKKDIRFQFVLSFASIRFGKPQRPAWKAVHSVTDCAEDRRSGAVGNTNALHLITPQNKKEPLPHYGRGSQKNLYFFIVVRENYSNGHSKGLQVDKQVEKDSRSSAQGLFFLMTNGLGASIGMIIAQQVVNSYTIENITNWTSVWIAFTSYALVICLLFSVLFKEK